jgi:hypothetical protein
MHGLCLVQEFSFQLIKDNDHGHGKRWFMAQLPR